MTHCTSLLDFKNSQIKINFSNKRSTGFSGLPAIVNKIKNHPLTSEMLSVLCRLTGRTNHILNVYTDADLFIQLLAQGFAGASNLTDAENLKNDPGFVAALGELASSSTLTRYLQEISTPCQDHRQAVLGDTDLYTLKKHDLLRIGSAYFEPLNQTLLRNCLRDLKANPDRNGSAHHRLIIVDVDSTFIGSTSKEL